MSGILNLLLGSAAGVIKDAFFNLVTLLSNTTATNGAQNNTFLDSSTNTYSITRNGNATQGTFSPFSQTGWSVSFDGAQTSPSLSFPSNSAYSLGSTSDWTIEFWVFFNVMGAEMSLVERADGTGAPGWTMDKGSADYFWFSNGGTTYTGSTKAEAGKWYHVCAMRTSGNIYLFVNGVLDITPVSMGNFSDGSTPLSLGERDGGQTFALNGYLSNVRIVKGTAVYSTGGFTVPTAPLTAITNTTFLSCQSNRFVDNSTTNATATTTTNSAVQAFSPFVPDTAYSTSLVGGSGYSGTTTSTLSVNSQPLINVSDWTVEFWMYPTQYNNNGGLFGASNGGGTNAKLYFYVSGSNLQLTGYSGGFTTILANAYPALNQWTYVSVSRSSSTGNAYLYYNGVLQQTGAIAAITGITNPFYFFSDGEGASPGFYGYISNARVSNTARYTGSSYSIPTALTTADANTQLLTNFTNAGIFDAAAKNDLETVGNAQVSTTQAKWGTTSMSFPATNGNYLVSQPKQSNFLFGTGNFTIEAFVYPTAFSNAAAGIFGYGLDGGYTDWVLELDTSGNALWVDNNSGRFYASSALSLNAWTHIAVVRTNSAITLYYNGVSVGTNSTISNITGNSASARLCVGTGPQNIGGRQFIGYMDDLRITKYARYTANFTPPAAAFPIQ